MVNGLSAASREGNVSDDNSSEENLDSITSASTTSSTNSLPTTTTYTFSLPSVPAAIAAASLADQSQQNPSDTRLALVQDFQARLRVLSSLPVPPLNFPPTDLPTKLDRFFSTYINNNSSVSDEVPIGSADGSPADIRNSNTT